jgi:hypothetical protein
MKKHNFLLATLCDNDFGRHIKDVLSEHSDYITQNLENNDVLMNYTTLRVLLKQNFLRKEVFPKDHN